MMFESEIENKTNLARSCSSLSWDSNSFRASASTLSLASLLSQTRHYEDSYGLENLIKISRSLNLRRYHYEELVREENLGEGVSYLVERCVVGKEIFAVKHVKFSRSEDGRSLRAKLKSIVLEIRIMRHAPLQMHPNIIMAHGYGWNVRQKVTAPFILIEYAPMGTLRDYFQRCGRVQGQQSDLLRVQLLVGDVAAGLSALHGCGMVHGDVKLDNMLVFQDTHRPTGAMAKVGDFGHAILTGDDSTAASTHSRYGGTSLYNAPEVQNQNACPILPPDLPQCDIWSFGLLLWEACLGGLAYTAWIKENRFNHYLASDLLEMAKECIPGCRQGSGIDKVLKVVLNKTLQEDSKKRVGFADLPIYTQWHVLGVYGCQATLTLHLDTPHPTYETLRFETRREIMREHEQQILTELKRVQAEQSSQDNGSVAWQIVLCAETGFGCEKNSQDAYRFAEIARTKSHPLAQEFTEIFVSNTQATSTDKSYSSKVSRLLRATNLGNTMPPLVRSCFDGDSATLLRLLSVGANANLSSADGGTIFHWLFMLRHPDEVVNMIQRQKSPQTELSVNLTFTLTREPHPQWPLRLAGTPLCVAIAVDNLPAVRALLALGADALVPAYAERQFDQADCRSSWTPLHIAAQYHCPSILHVLLERVSHKKLVAFTTSNPLSQALSFSTTLERRAMHGVRSHENLKRTIEIIQRIQPLTAVGSNGTTTVLMQAIDFQDYDVVSALLEAEPKLCITPFTSRRDGNIFSLPIHFAAQVAARRDTKDSLEILHLIHRTQQQFYPSSPPSLDSRGRTPLHMSVTGPSDLATGWMLEREKNLLEVQDNMGRTPLHYCASATNLELLLSSGANITDPDKFGLTPMHYACFQGKLDLIQAMLKSTAKGNINVRTNNDYGTPLHCAVIRGSIDVVLELLVAGAQPNLTDEQGNTALMVAARLNRPSIMRLLIRHGADVSVKNANGRDAWDIAVSAGPATHSGVTDLLQSIMRTPGADATQPVSKPPTASTKHSFSSTSHPQPALDFAWKIYDAQGPSILHDITRNDFENDLDQKAQSNPPQSNPTSLESRDHTMQHLHAIYNHTTAKHCPSTPLTPFTATAFITTTLLFSHSCFWTGPQAPQIWDIITLTTFNLSKALRYSTALSTQLTKKGPRLSSHTSGSTIRPKITLTAKDLEALSPNTFHTQAAACVAEMLTKTKPSWVLPGRSATDLQDMILYELGRTPEPSWKEYLDVMPHSLVFARFPELQARCGFAVEEYFQWERARDQTKER
ncbi:hypothetical protein B0T21DRAFT_338099 [Apiosordaria backusii]|uniref:Protein kinase domain-containing protein n=1 Tax=Apiosordaria backusii TaxID=314023 RepID=A0AA40E1E3_9PEZI|nr:hypothetical protein B0T21DRAFT_338099 [Apiosordaria backusii]